MDDEHSTESDGADELLRRAMLDDSSAFSLSVRIDGLPVSETVTIIFYARRDLGVKQTYLTPGSGGAGSHVRVSDLLRVPCDLDLADAEDREDAERLYAQQARVLRDAVVGADIVLDVWREPLLELAGTVVKVDRSVSLSVSLPAPRLMPTARRTRRADRGDASVQPTDARGGAPSHGDRVLAAGSDQGLPAVRRPRALRRGLPCHRDRARTRVRGASGAPRGVGRAVLGTERRLSAWGKSSDLGRLPTVLYVRTGRRSGSRDGRRSSPHSRSAPRTPTASTSARMGGVPLRALGTPNSGAQGRSAGSITPFRLSLAVALPGGLGLCPSAMRLGSAVDDIAHEPTLRVDQSVDHL